MDHVSVPAGTVGGMQRKCWVLQRKGPGVGKCMCVGIQKHREGIKIQNFNIQWVEKTWTEWEAYMSMGVELGAESPEKKEWRKGNF